MLANLSQMPLSERQHMKHSQQLKSMSKVREAASLCSEDHRADLSAVKHTFSGTGAKGGEQRSQTIVQPSTSQLYTASLQQRPGLATEAASLEQPDELPVEFREPRPSISSSPLLQLPARKCRSLSEQQQPGPRLPHSEPAAKIDIEFDLDGLSQLDVPEENAATNSAADAQPACKIHNAANSNEQLGEAASEQLPGKNSKGQTPCPDRGQKVPNGLESANLQPQGTLQPQMPDESYH